jgi:orotate phosphoribosyltransferase
MLNEFEQFVVEKRIIGFFQEPLTLKSGRESHWYVNWRTPATDAYSLDYITDTLAEFIEELDVPCDTIYGVPSGASVLGAVTQMKYAKKSPFYREGSHIISIGRDKPKTHGNPKDKFYVGAPKGYIVVLEDVTTTGGSLYETIEKLNSTNDCRVSAAVALTNRNELFDGKDVPSIMKEKGIPYFAMSSALTLLPEAYKRQQPGEYIGKKVEAYFERYGSQPLRLIER